MIQEEEVKMYAYAKAKYLMSSGPKKKSRLAEDLKATESVKHMFERHNIPYTASCDRKADDELKELMNDCYKGVPTDVAFRAENEYRGRHM